MDRLLWAYSHGSRQGHGEGLAEMDHERLATPRRLSVPFNVVGLEAIFTAYRLCCSNAGHATNPKPEQRRPSVATASQLEKQLQNIGNDCTSPRNRDISLRVLASCGEGNERVSQVSCFRLS